MDLVVGRWTQRARVPGDAEAWRRRLDALAQGAVRRALAELPDPGGVWFVPRLALRLRVPAGAADEAVAEAWREGLRRALEEQSAEAVGFPDRASAELAALAASLEEAPPWWVARALRGRSAAAIVGGWLGTEPARVPEAVARLADGQPSRLARLVSADDADALTAGLERVWAGGAPVPLPERPPDGRVSPAHLGLLLAAEARRAPEARGAGGGGRRTETRSLPVEAAAVPARDAAVHPSPSAAPGAPPDGASSPDPPAGVPAASTGAPDRRARPPAPDADLLHTGPRAPGPADAAPAAGPPPRPPDPAVPPARVSAGGRWPLGLGGLFLLLRPLARHPWLAERSWPEWPEGLAAVAEVALDRVLGDLARAERAVVEDAHAELLGAFAPGWPLPPADDARRAQAGGVLDALLGDLDGAVRPVPVPAAWAQGVEPSDARLAAVLLRPARLALTPTHADLFLPLDAVDLLLRRAGWDLDPGWLPGLRRVVRFHYEDR